MNHEIEGLSFQPICTINIEKDENGNGKEYSPQSTYQNTKRLSLNRYGNGPFCRFTIPKINNGKAGVYILLVSGTVMYVGECGDLGGRYNNGYGNISPRNCFEGGQSTNCRINSLVLQAYKQNHVIELLFLESQDRFSLENQLITRLKPEWNRTIGKPSKTIQKAITNQSNSSNFKSSSEKEEKRSSKQSTGSGKYYKLEEYLRKCENDVTLSFEEIEKIIGFVLPPSAYNHMAWWANSGHSHANAWTNVGMRIGLVKLGKSVFLKKSELESKLLTGSKK